jgi:PAS domain S-box-containing protein
MKALMIYNIYQVILSLAVSGVCYFAFANYFAGRTEAGARSESIADFRLSLSGAALTLILDFGNETRTIPLSSLAPFEADEDVSNAYIHRENGWREQGMAFLITARNSYAEFERFIANAAREEGIAIYDIFPILFERDVEMTTCHMCEPSETQFFNLRTSFLLSYTSTAMVIGTDPVSWYGENNAFCTVFASFRWLTVRMNDLLSADKDANARNSAEDEQFLSLLEYLVPSLYAVLGFLPFPVIIALMLRELRLLCRLMTNTESQYKIEASHPLRKVVGEARDLHYEPRHDTWDSRLTLVYCMIMALYVGLVVITIYVFTAAISANTNFENLNVWRYLSAGTRPRSIEMLVHLFQAVLLTNQSLKQNFSTPWREIETLESRAVLVDSDTSELIDGGNECSSIIGVSSVIDDILISSQCGDNDLSVETSGPSNFHNLYDCGSLMHQLRMFTEFQRLIVSKLAMFEGIANHTAAVHAYHLLMVHAMPKMLKIVQELTSLIAATESNYRDAATILFGCGIAVSLSAAVLVFIYKSTIDQTFHGAIIVLRRCSPAGIVANEHLLRYLLNQEEENEPILTTTASIIHNAQDGIVCISAHGIIDSVNTSVTRMLGFIPEQLLGQHIQVMLADQDGPKLVKQLEMMVRREAPKQFTKTYKMVTDSDEEISCLVNLMAMTGNDGKTIESFVVIFKNVSDLLAQQEAADVAKEKSEKLLYEILPRDIVNRLNQGEKDITFVVPSATLMFIDIQKFSAYTAKLSPQEIMGNLSLIFSGFDGLLLKYPLITKIKLIGDVYMCGAGLFTPDEEPRNHAAQMVHFGLEAIQSLEETNVKLEATLAVRIGVNTGGPIIAGVLGTDKPVFDIIGDPINIAARLQSTCVPNRVQISEDTYELLKDQELTIEPRGEIFLKGKGKRPAFLVIPAPTFPFTTSDAAALAGA